MVKEFKDKTLFSTLEVANILGVSRVTVFNRIRSGEINALKVGRAYLISKEELNRYLGKEELTEERKQEISQNIDLILSEYGNALKMLGNE